MLLGIDIGGTKVAVRAEGDGPPVEHTMTWPEAGSVGDDLDALRAVLTGLPAPDAAGVAMPATCNRDGTVLAWPGRPGWIGLNLHTAFRTVLGATPLTWADDGDLAALAEAGHAGLRDVLYVGVGTGIGGGIVRDGRGWPGPDRGSCELGHLVVDLDGPRCDCGRHGCLQSFASGPAVLRRAAELRGSAVTPAEFAAGVRGGAPWAEVALARGVAALAAAVVGVCELAHPDAVLIGGGFGAGIPGLPERVSRVAESLRRLGGEPLDIRPAALGAHSSLAGALLLAREILQSAEADSPRPKNSR